ncbi:ferredoxin-type protein NapG [Cohaesibacter intestini]|uniref:ferredoxin-type protein NapG n=1 Tax=Cohaesibacter intestini TaxID=2211145 RepID=UPI000DEBF5FE|nr:ferredoxin-type protein NapG [Cohaesibacter intestini]
MSTNAKKPANPDRRRFLTEVARGSAGCALAGMGLAWLAKEAQALPATAIRPPGALAEEAFLAACVRCGLCVRDCPYDTLTLAELGRDAAATGTPFFTARTIPCEMCDDIPCVVACPTGALDPALDVIDDADMGVAVLIDEEHCLNALGLRCDVCYRVCPLIDEAITLEQSHNARSGHHAIFMPTVHADKCTGCGKCEKSCVLPGESAIRVLPTRLARVEPAEHYRLGWENREKIVDELIDLPDRLPGPGTDNLKAPGGFEQEFKPTFSLPQGSKGQ